MLNMSAILYYAYIVISCDVLLQKWLAKLHVTGRAGRVAGPLPLHLDSFSLHFASAFSPSFWFIFTLIFNSSLIYFICILSSIWVIFNVFYFIFIELHLTSIYLSTSSIYLHLYLHSTFDLHHIIQYFKCYFWVWDVIHVWEDVWFCIYIMKKVILFIKSSMSAWSYVVI